MNRGSIDAIPKKGKHPWLIPSFGNKVNLTLFKSSMWNQVAEKI
jgi:hypothetical protein